MSLDHILLGMLRQPASGYDLRQRFEGSVRHFWFAELSQIYPALSKLEKDGLLTSERLDSKRGPKRRVFQLTDAGREELDAWLREDPIIPKDRITYLAQVFFMDELQDLGATRRFFIQLKNEITTRLGVLQAIEAGWMAELDTPAGAGAQIPDDGEFHMYLTLRMGIHSLRSRVAWCDESLIAIEARAKTTPHHG